MTTDKPTILLVEDNPSDSILMRAALDRAGVVHHLQVVGDGEEAIKYLVGNGQYADRLLFPMPRLVLLDLGLPKKSGFEVLDWIRQLPVPAAFDVVVVSATNAMDEVARAYDFGARSFIVKPNSLEDLVELVRPLEGYLNRQQGSALPLGPTIERPLTLQGRAPSDL